MLIKSNVPFSQALLIFLAWSIYTNPSQAATESIYKAYRDEINDGTVRLIAGGRGGTYTRFGSDISAAVDTATTRFLVTLGKGSVSNISDVIFLDGIDMGIVQLDALKSATIMNSNGQTILDNEQIRKKICYVTKLYSEEYHVVALSRHPRTGRPINTLSDLKGLRISIGSEGSGTFETSKNIFNKIDPNDRPEFSIQTADRALTSLKLTAAGRAGGEGEVHAVVVVAGMPVDVLAGIPADAGLKLLSVEEKYLDKIVDYDSYDNAKISSSDYPTLFHGTQDSIQTFSVMSSLIMYDFHNNPFPGSEVRMKNTDRAIGYMFDALDTLQTSEEFHSKWASVDTKSEIQGDGWKRCHEAILRTE